MARKKESTDLKSVINNLPDYLSNKGISSTGCIILDYILNGPLEYGQFIQVLGESGIGKTTILLSLASSLCEVGVKVLYVDAEGSITNEQLNNAGLKEYLMDSFIYVSESTFDKVEKVMDKVIATGEVHVIILDSLAALINSCFTEKDSKISVTTNSSLYISRPLTNFMNKYKSKAVSEKYCFIFANQWRQRISNTGSVDKPYGGKNVAYNSDLIIEISKTPSSGLGSDFKSLFSPLNEGFPINIKLIKSNKRAPKVFPSYFIYEKGIYNLATIVYALVSIGIIQKNESYYSYTDSSGTIKVNGLENFLSEIGPKMLEMYNDHKDKIINYYNLK